MNTIAKIMSEFGLVARKVRRRRGLTRPGKRPAAPDFVRRDFTAGAPDLVWCGDMTEIETGEGKLCLATVIDLFSRRLLRRPASCSKGLVRGSTARRWDGALLQGLRLRQADPLPAPVHDSVQRRSW